MGVHGLWRLIEPSGKPVPFETLENKVLAVDISLWLHQAVKGYQDSRGATVPNAHLLGIYHRVCKLLYFRIKPVFVFDGGVPALKRQTIVKRNQLKSKKDVEVDRLQKQILNTILKHTAINNLHSENANRFDMDSSKEEQKKNKNNIYQNIYKLENSNSYCNDSDNDSDEDEQKCSPSKQWDLHTIDMESIQFKSLPVDVRHEILTDLKETRKQSSWGRIHEIPKISNDFSTYQMNRLLKRQAVQAALENAEKEMGGKTLSLTELESMLQEEGVISKQNLGTRIASDKDTKFVLIKDTKVALTLDNTAQGEAPTSVANPEEFKIQNPVVIENKNKADQEFESDLQKALVLSLANEPSTSEQALPQKSHETKQFVLEKYANADFQSSFSEDEAASNVNMTSAQSYMSEYSGLTPSEISKILDVGKELENYRKQTNTQGLTSMAQYTWDKKEVDPNEIICAEQSVQETVDRKAISVTIKPDDGFDLKDDLFSDIFERYRKNDAPVLEVEKGDRDVDVLSSSDSSDFIDTEDVNFKPNNEESIAKNIREEETVVSPPESDGFREIFEAPKSVAGKENEIFDVPSETKSLPNETRDELREPLPEAPARIKMELDELRNDLQREKMELMSEKATKERIASNITDQMYQEAQELLELFGVPYLSAPMEAEAQCAFLDEAKLTDGTITDDSDIWLFGGRTVYKNFFNQNKYVAEFRADGIQTHFKLTRDEMILLALLVGSDYTPGLQGVGPVTALEILAAFPPTKLKDHDPHHLISGLKEFRSWFTKGESPGPGRVSLKRKLRNLVFTEAFPSVQVVEGYLVPEVDTSKETFSWGRPNVDALIEFAKEKFGWTRAKAEQILQPVVARLAENRMQKSIKDYFQTNFKVDSGNVDSKLSKRVKSAISNLGQDPSVRVIQDVKEEVEKKLKTRENVTKSKRVRSSKKNTPGDDEISSSSRQIVPNVKKIENNKEEEVADKIEAIRRRRKLKAELDAAGVPRRKISKKTKIDVIPEDLKTDEDVFVLMQTAITSGARVEEITNEAKAQLDKMEANKSDCSRVRVLTKEVIPQRKNEQSLHLRNKLKAIEVFRKSKKGPGFVPKKGRKRREPKSDAELSEISD
ncbi:DNA excision repair protein ERCC-5 homolog [Cylas formicarius]|uniref:DNA excision repair protein ERCC-5 homolog n=1 Tax=Cylas formicarius TaxID=197179 RepID=UPI002958613B|nr:DNA excision repair protein ERCC-5 homolog [Cylas formicarius]